MYFKARISTQNFHYKFFAFFVFTFIAGACIRDIWFNTVVGNYGIVRDGKSLDIYSFGVFATIVCTIIQSFHVGTNIRQWNFPIILSFAISIVLLFIILDVQTRKENTESFKMVYKNLEEPIFFFMILFASVIVILPLYSLSRF
jgi:hypothetical protein